MAALDGPKYGGPGIFALGNNRDKATAEMGAYGVDLTQGNPYAEFAAQSRGSGLGAQMGALGMYQDAVNGGRPSVAGLQSQQGLQAMQRAQGAAGAQLRGGNVAGAQGRVNAAGAGAQAQMAQAGGMAGLQEQGQNQAGYAGLGTQLVQQGLQYDQLAAQQQLGAAEDQMKMYLGARGLDQQAKNINRGFALNLAQSVVGAAGGMAQAGSTIGSSIEYNPDGTRKY